MVENTLAMCSETIRAALTKHVEGNSQEAL
jgi:hypothetical protein